MGRETQRRLALLAVVGALAASWTIALHPPSVTGVALASSTRAAVPVNNVHVRACPFPTALRSAFEAAARDASLPPALLYAVAKVESNLHQDAESSAGARGLLQVMPATGDALELDIDEPSANVLAGARYLRLLFDRFKSSDVALAAYNAGPTAVERAGGAPSIGVQRYVSNVNLAWHSVAGCR
jgi:soluble lytic murein transglycosylase-like protein